MSVCQSISRGGVRNRTWQNKHGIVEAVHEICEMRNEGRAQFESYACMQTCRHAGMDTAVAEMAKAGLTHTSLEGACLDRDGRQAYGLSADVI